MLYPPTTETARDGYERVELFLVPGSGPEATIHPEFSDDLRSWMGTDTAVQGEDTLYVRSPGSPGHVTVGADTDAPFGAIVLPPEAFDQLGCRAYPQVQTVLIAPPGQARQLERFE